MKTPFGLQGILLATATLVVITTGSNSQIAFAQPNQPTPCANVKIEGLKPGQGYLYLAAYDSVENYFKKPVWQTRLVVTQTIESVQLCGSQFDHVAISGYQDLNDNGKLDTNLLGVPTEPYGASGTPPNFSAPTWDTTKVKFVPNDVISVRM